MAAHAYAKYDESLKYPEIQADIGRKLLKLRVTFTEYTPAHPSCSAYKVNFKLTGDLSNTMFLLKGPKHCNPHTKEWLTMHKLKYE